MRALRYIFNPVAASLAGVITSQLCIYNNQSPALRGLAQNPADDPGGLCAAAAQYRAKRDALLDVAPEKLAAVKIGIADQAQTFLWWHQWGVHGSSVREILGRNREYVPFSEFPTALDMSQKPIDILSRSIAAPRRSDNQPVMGFLKAEEYFPNETIIVNSLGNNFRISGQIQVQHVIKAPNILVGGSLKNSAHPEAYHKTKGFDLELNFSPANGLPVLYALQSMPLERHEGVNICVPEVGTSWATPEIVPMVAQLRAKYPDHPDLVSWALLITRTSLGDDPLIVQHASNEGGIINPTAADKLLKWVYDNNLQSTPMEIVEQQHLPKLPITGLPDNLQLYTIDTKAAQNIVPTSMLIHYKIADDTAKFKLKLLVYRQQDNPEYSNPIDDVTIRWDDNARSEQDKIASDMWLRFDPLDSNHRQKWKEQPVKFVLQVEWLDGRNAQQAPAFDFSVEMRGFSKTAILSQLIPGRLGWVLPAVANEMLRNPYAHLALDFAQDIQARSAKLPDNIREIRQNRQYFLETIDHLGSFPMRLAMGVVGAGVGFLIYTALCLSFNDLMNKVGKEETVTPVKKPSVLPSRRHM